MANPTLQDIQERFVYRDMIGIDGKDVTYLLNRIEKLEATIERVRNLPDRWRSGTLLRGHWINYNTHDECADELEKELNDE